LRKRKAARSTNSASASKLTSASCKKRGLLSAQSQDFCLRLILQRYIVFRDFRHTKSAHTAADKNRFPIHNGAGPRWIKQNALEFWFWRWRRNGRNRVGSGWHVGDNRHGIGNRCDWLRKRTFHHGCRRQRRRFDIDNPKKNPAATSNRTISASKNQLMPPREVDSTGDRGGGEPDGGLFCCDCLACLRASLIRLISVCSLRVRGRHGQ